MKLAPSLHRIGSDTVATYLVDDPSGVTLVDAGVSGQWKELVAELESMGRSIADVRALLLTHGDTDHIGFAERLRRDHGVPAHIHEADAARATGQEKSSPSFGKVRIGPLLKFLWYAGRRGGLRTTYLSEVRTISAEKTLDVPGQPRVVPVPGHSPGSVAYLFTGVDAVMVGDALTTRHVLTGEKGPGPAPFTDDPEQAMASLGVLEGLESRWVLPGHGPPWSEGTADAVRRVRAAVARRDAESD